MKNTRRRRPVAASTGFVLALMLATLPRIASGQEIPSGDPGLCEALSVCCKDFIEALSKAPNGPKDAVKAWTDACRDMAEAYKTSGNLVEESCQAMLDGLSSTKDDYRAAFAMNWPQSCDEPLWGVAPEDLQAAALGTAVPGEAAEETGEMLPECKQFLDCCVALIDSLGRAGSMPVETRDSMKAACVQASAAHHLVPSNLRVAACLNSVASLVMQIDLYLALPGFKLPAQCPAPKSSK